VAVHCRQGIGRSGMIAAGALMRSGVGADKAVDVVSAARGVAIPETAAQRYWLYQLDSERPAVVSS
jgi:protein-tyrosine phosphatase